MGHDAIKLELIEWLTKFENNDTIEYLKIIKDTDSSDDWWDELSEEQQKGIERGLKDIDDGLSVPYEEVRLKYGF